MHRRFILLCTPVMQQWLVYLWCSVMEYHSAIGINVSLFQNYKYLLWWPAHQRFLVSRIYIYLCALYFIAKRMIGWLTMWKLYSITWTLRLFGFAVFTVQLLTIITSFSYLLFAMRLTVYRFISLPISGVSRYRYLLVFRGEEILKLLMYLKCSTTQRQWQKL